MSAFTRLAKRRMCGVACVLTLFACSGCAGVPAWERGDLARPEMALEPQPGQRALQEHVYSSREAGAAGATGQGGGCGCY